LTKQTTKGIGMTKRRNFLKICLGFLALPALPAPISTDKIFWATNIVRGSSVSSFYIDPAMQAFIWDSNRQVVTKKVDET